MDRYFIVDFNKLDHDSLITFNALCCLGGVLTREESLAKFKEVWNEGFRMGHVEPGSYGLNQEYGWEEYKKTL